MWDKEEIVCSYRTAKNKAEQIEILAELTASDIDTIIMVLKDAGEKMPRSMKRFRRCVDCNCYIPVTARSKRCKECYATHDREMRRLRYHKRKQKNE